MAAGAQQQRRPFSTAEPPPFAVLMCGLPGKMGHTVAEAVVSRWGADALLPFSPTGADIAESETEVAGKPGTVRLLKPDERDDAWLDVLKVAAGRPILAADYTHPDAAVGNCKWYRDHGLPFVMGTTGYDMAAAEEAIGEDLYCVLAPNMGKPIVLFQAMLAHAAETYPNALDGYKLSAVESHQAGKVDTSGTAKAVVASLAALGPAEFAVQDIEMLRAPAAQAAFGVTEAYIGGHAYHTYRLESPDRTVALEFKHNVDGRAVYGEGTADAIEFLWARFEAGAEQKRWSMLDILAAGGI